MSSFKEFVSRYNDGSILDDAAWRAYDIEGMALDSHAHAAAREVVRPADAELSLAYHTAAAMYDVKPVARVKMLLAYWYVWRSIANGTRRRAALRATE